MARPQVIKDMLTVFDAPRYPPLALGGARQYKFRHPTPHACFDGFLPPYLAVDIAAAFPDLSNKGWTVHSNEHADRMFWGD